MARALESEKPEGVRICFDPYAVKFLNRWFYQFTRFFITNGYAERTGPGVNGYLVARARYIDDVLQATLDDGLDQLVILGAGYDSRAYRFEQLKRGVKVFEVDHPATQQEKMKKVKAILGELPSSVTYAGIDFNTQTLEARLPELGYDERLKTLFILEGLLMYLSSAAVEGLLAFIRQHSGPGSQVIFDYIHSALLEGTVKHGEVSRMRRVRLVSGEGLTFSIPEGKVKEYLESKGFTNVVDIDGAGLHQRYFTGMNAKRKVAWGYSIVLAEIG